MKKKFVIKKFLRYGNKLRKKIKKSVHLKLKSAKSLIGILNENFLF
jgi:small nuclear ribonucleoprotein (snRNP)-like protein